LYRILLKYSTNELPLTNYNTHQVNGNINSQACKQLYLIGIRSKFYKSLLKFTSIVNFTNSWN